MEKVSDEQQKARQDTILYALRGELQKLHGQSDILTQPSGKYCETINGCLKKVLPEIVKSLNISEQEIRRILGKKIFYEILTSRRECLWSNQTVSEKLAGADEYHAALKGLNFLSYNKDGKRLSSPEEKITLMFLFRGSWMSVWINTDMTVEGSYRMYCTFKDPSVIKADILKSLALQLHKEKWLGEMKIPDKLERLLSRRDAFVVYAPNEGGLRQAYEIIRVFCEDRNFEAQYDYGKTFEKEIKGCLFSGWKVHLTYHEALANYLADPTSFEKKYGEDALSELIQEAEKIKQVVEGVKTELPEISLEEQEFEPPDL